MEKLFIHIFNMSISASYLIFAVLIVRLLLRKAPKTMRCFLWFLVGIRLLVPFSIESIFSLIPNINSVEESFYEIQQQKPGFKTENIHSFANQSVSKTENSSIEEIPVNRPKKSLSVWAKLWILGIGLMAGYMTISWQRLRKRVKTAVPNDFELENGYLIRIYQSELIETPFLFGIIKPRIYVPYTISDKALPYVILHEKTHQKRRDYLIKPIGFVLLSVYWFNPCIWIAYILLCKDIELVCDEKVVQQVGVQYKREYSQALLSSAINRRMIAACPVAFGEVGVKERVTNILSYKKPAFWILAAAILACIIVPVCFMTQKKEEPQEDIDAKVYMDEDTYKLSDHQKQLLKSAAELSQKMTAQDVIATDQDLKETLTQIEELQKNLQSEKTALQKELESLKELEKDQNQGATQASLLEVSEQFETAIVQLEQQKNMLNELLINVEAKLLVKSSIEQWAQAFCSRDGEMIIRLANEKTEQKLIDADMLVHGFENGKDYAGFGWSSPWPWDFSYEEDSTNLNYRIVNITDRSAEILYYAWVSDPHLTVWREQLTYDINDDKVVITSETLQYRDSICTLEEFYQAYPDGAIKGTMMDYYSYNGAGEALNENAKEAKGRYAALFQPDTAAIFLLNLLNNPNKVGTIVKPSEDENTCTVTLEFYEHGDRIDVTMIRPYGLDGIWLPWSEGESGADNNQSSGTYIISNMIVDDTIKRDAQMLEELFSNHHEFMTGMQFPKSVDLNGDGIEEKIEMIDLGYNGGDGGYALRVTDTKTGKQIPLPDGYTEEAGFPIMTEYRTRLSEASSKEDASILIQLGEENQYKTLAELQIGALMRIYERKHTDYEIKEYLQKESFDTIRPDAISGCNIITFNGEETPTIVLKTYISGLLGHVDTLGYVITELRLQKDNTWKSNSYFLLDSCNDKVLIQQNTEVSIEQGTGDSNLLFDNDTHINLIPLQPEE